MKSFLILLLLPLLVFADSESDEEVHNTIDFICGLYDDVEVECRSCAEKAISEAEITDTEERAKFESEALAILHSCSDHLPEEVSNCVQEVDSIFCLDNALQTKESNLVAEYTCKRVEPKEECLECVSSTSLNFVKSMTDAIRSLRTSSIGASAAVIVYFKCLSHLSLEELDNLFNSESSE